jgi:hypothetical protein
VASYASGQSGTSAPITITVNNAPPTTSVLLPSNGATQSGGTATLDASASANVTSVSYELSGGAFNDQPISVATSTLYGWIAHWNTTTVPDGTYTLQSVASYANGQSTISAPITITVNNPPPTTSVLIPSNGATQSGGTATLDASASANVNSVSYELSGGAFNDQPISVATSTALRLDCPLEHDHRPGRHLHAAKRGLLRERPEHHQRAHHDHGGQLGSNRPSGRR